MGEKKKSFAQVMGITRTVVRPPEESDIQQREDRIGKYFEKYLKKFIFVEFSKDYLAKSKVGDIMEGVPIPLRKEDLEEFKGGDGLSPTHIGENMVWIMGSDPHFKYTEKYVAYLHRLFNYKIYEGMVREGRDAAEKEDFDNACIHFRASLCMKPDYLHGMYSYARVCRSMYLEGKDEEYIGRFKAEALDFFELVTETHPRFAQGYYYLGYGYLNMGLYGKAKAAWKEFLRFTRNGKDRKEIHERMKQLEDPTRIEEGCNHVTSGRFEKGREILTSYEDSRFNDWWPLHYYLGVAHVNLGEMNKGEASLKKVLALNGSHIETMEELLVIYQAKGDKDNYEKYEKKIALVRSSMSKKELAALDKGKPKGKKGESSFNPKVKKAEERTSSGVKRLK